jgi:hypothetical protein
MAILERIKKEEKILPACDSIILYASGPDGMKGEKEKATPI